jgi:MYXO-CTERM domain-containing protein
MKIRFAAWLCAMLVAVVAVIGGCRSIGSTERVGSFYPSTSGAISIATASGSTAADSGVTAGTLLYVQSFRRWFTLSPDSGASIDGVTVLGGNGGNRRWLWQQQMTDPYWIAYWNGATVTIGGAGSSDEGDGITTPLATPEEVQRRLGIFQQFPDGWQSTFQIAQNYPSNAFHFNAMMSAVKSGTRPQVNLVAAPSAITSLSSGTFTAVQPLNRAARQFFQVTDSTNTFSTAAFQRIRITSGARAGAISWVVAHPSTHVVETGNWVIPPSNATPFAKSTPVVPQTGDPYSVEFLPYIVGGNITMSSSSTTVPTFVARDLLFIGELAIRAFATKQNTEAWIPNGQPFDPVQHGGVAIGCLFESMIDTSDCYYHACSSAQPIALPAPTLQATDGILVPKGVTVHLDAFTEAGNGVYAQGEAYIDNDSLFYSGGGGIVLGTGGIVHISTAGFDGPGGEFLEGSAIIAGAQRDNGTNLGAMGPSTVDIAPGRYGNPMLYGTVTGGAEVFGPGTTVQIAGDPYQVMGSLLGGSGAQFVFALNGGHYNTAVSFDPLNGGAASASKTTTWQKLSQPLPGGFGGNANFPASGSNVVVYNTADVPVPKQSPGLVLWLEADTNVTQAGGLVTAVGDQSAMGNNYISANGGNARPTFIASAQNGLPGLSFDASHQLLVADNSGTPAFFDNSGGNEHTFTIAFKLLSAGSFPTPYSYSDAAFEFRGFAGTGVPELVRQVTVADGSVSLVDSRFHVVQGVWRKDNSFQLYVDGASVASASAALAVTTTSSLNAIGGRSAGTDLANMVFLGITAHNQALGTADLALQRSYFTTKYAFSVSPVFPSGGGALALAALLAAVAHRRRAANDNDDADLRLDDAA